MSNVKRCAYRNCIEVLFAGNYIYIFKEKVFMMQTATLRKVVYHVAGLRLLVPQLTYNIQIGHRASYINKTLVTSLKVQRI